MMMKEEKLDALFEKLAQLPPEVEYSRAEQWVAAAASDPAMPPKKTNRKLLGFSAGLILLCSAAVFFLPENNPGTAKTVAAGTNSLTGSRKANNDSPPLKSQIPSPGETSFVSVEKKQAILPDHEIHISGRPDPGAASSKQKVPARNEEPLVADDRILLDASGLDSGYVYTGDGTWMDTPENNTPPCRPDPLFIAFRQALIADGLLPDTASFSFRISNRSLYVNEKKQSKTVAARYKNLYRQQTGRKMRLIGSLEYTLGPCCGNCPTRNVSGFRIVNGNW